MRKVAKKVCKLSLFSQLSAPIKSGVSKLKANRGVLRDEGPHNFNVSQRPFLGEV